MFLCHLMVDKPHKVFMEAYGRHSFRMRVVKKFKFAAFYSLVEKIDIFEKIKYTRKRMLIRFVDFEMSNYKGLYVRISVIDTTVPVKERSIYFLYPVISIGCTKLMKLLASKIVF